MNNNNTKSCYETSALEVISARLKDNEKYSKEIADLQNKGCRIKTSNVSTVILVKEKEG